MMCSGRELPPDEVRWIFKLFSYGFSWRKIARTTGFSFWTIAKYRKVMLKEKRRERWRLAKQSAASVTKEP